MTLQWRTEWCQYVNRERKCLSPLYHYLLKNAKLQHSERKYLIDAKIKAFNFFPSNCLLTCCRSWNHGPSAHQSAAWFWLCLQTFALHRALGQVSCTRLEWSRAWFMVYCYTTVQTWPASSGTDNTKPLTTHAQERLISPANTAEPT